MLHAEGLPSEMSWQNRPLGGNHVNRKLCLAQFDLAVSQLGLSDSQLP
ncbi:hypothetical protein RMSM_07542 [Rhodopirellula maiorica SM1]|uniref:Uncharacterized protein n=1 Tax=Rhodopirellula maiorica SM1 TaxID=1265738 RepID=M5RNG4_9BACT|nr:hypothetical protein RMSM_07542 [Rhodopirellula maiorica SM1]